MLMSPQWEVSLLYDYLLELVMSIHIVSNVVVHIVRHFFGAAAWRSG